MLEKNSNPHIPYKQNVQIYHNKIAKLVKYYAAKDTKLIDIGCGVGHTLFLINKYRPDLKLYAIDFDETCLKITKQRVHNVETFKQNLNEISLKAITSDIDFIVISHVMEHIYCPYQLIIDLFETLNKGGYMVMAVPNPVRPVIMTYSLLQKFAINKGHVYSWDRHHWINFIENILCLNVIKYECDYIQIIPEYCKLKLPNIFNSLLNKLELWLCNFFPWFSFSNIVLIKK